MQGAFLSRLAMIFVVGFGLFSFSSAQDANPAAATEEAVFRLPNMFGKLGVDDGQRDKLIAIHQSYEEKLEKLRSELKAVVKERDAAMEASLTEGQKLRLKELRTEARQDQAKRAAAKNAKATTSE